jgi:hypothetical protein
MALGYITARKESVTVDWIARVFNPQNGDTYIVACQAYAPWPWRMWPETMVDLGSVSPGGYPCEDCKKQYESLIGRGFFEV